MRDHYEILGIPRHASDRMVQIAFEGKLKALADPGYAAAPSVKREEERQLRLAFATLSVPHLRAAYEDSLDAQAVVESDEERGWLPRGRLAAVALLLVVLAGAGVAWERTQARERAEAARAEQAQKEAREARWRERAEQADARRQEQAEEEEASRIAGKAWQERTDLERERAAYDAQRRAQEAQAMGAELSARDREAQARAAREQAEQQARRTDEEKRREAQQEVERQKAYLRGLELDEERARVERAERVQREAREQEYRRLLEERQAK